MCQFEDNSKQIKITSLDKVVEKLELSSLLVGKSNGSAAMGNRSAVP